MLIIVADVLKYWMEDEEEPAEELKTIPGMISIRGDSQDHGNLSLNSSRFHALELDEKLDIWSLIEDICVVKLVRNCLEKNR